VNLCEVVGMKFSSFYEVITKIDGVSHVKIVSEDDNLQEIHILASTSRAPKQIVRDIESALLAVFDYRIDRKIISVAQIDLGESKGIKRIKLDAISFETGDINIDCSVKLNYEGEEYLYSVWPEETDPSSELDSLIDRIGLPVTAVRAYRGEEMIKEITLQIRGNK